MSTNAPMLTKGQRIRITRTMKQAGSVLRGGIVHEGTISELYGGPLVSVSFLEDGDAGLGHIPVRDTDFEDVDVRALGWKEGTVAYIDLCEDGNPGHPDETDVLVVARGHGWTEILGGFRTFWFDEERVANVRPVHDGQVPK